MNSSFTYYQTPRDHQYITIDSIVNRYNDEKNVRVQGRMLLLYKENKQALQIKTIIKIDNAIRY